MLTAVLNENKWEAGWLTVDFCDSAVPPVAARDARRESYISSTPGGQKLHGVPLRIAISENKNCPGRKIRRWLKSLNAKDKHFPSE